MHDNLALKSPIALDIGIPNYIVDVLRYGWNISAKQFRANSGKNGATHDYFSHLHGNATIVFLTCLSCPHGGGSGGSGGSRCFSMQMLP